MTTESYGSLHELTPAQMRAALAIAGGATHTSVAEEIGVHRVTVTRWVNHHPGFIAELNQLRSEAVAEVKETIRRTTRSALDLVSAAIEGGDVAVALRWLKLGTMSSLTQEPSGSTEPRQVVESLRMSLPSALTLVLRNDDEPTQADAERTVRGRLEGDL